MGELASVRRISPGLLSAGLGNVPVEQTYLDITQGNRVFDSLYSAQLPKSGAGGPCGAWWRAVMERAESAPAEIVPGLLASTLEAAGVGVVKGSGASCAFFPPPARIQVPAKRLIGASAPHPRGSFEVRGALLRQLPALVSRLRGNDLLIAIERPPPANDRELAIGIAGRGFDGNLTSASTRTNGYVLSTDIAPTVLQQLGVGIPSPVSGQPIRSEGSVDPGEVASLGNRMAVISGRRGPVIGGGLLAWLLALGVAVVVTQGRLARPGVRLLGLSVVYLPLALLAAAAFEPSQGAEQAIAILGVPLLAALTLAALGGYRALAVASAATVLAYTADVIVGSPLTAISLLGPNPGLGVRFYGIGNELEALLVVLVIGGTGAGLAGFAPRLSPRGCAIAFLAIGMSFAAIFAVGQFGADVGAAVDFPAGAAVAAAVIAGGRRRPLLLVLAAPFIALALLALADLLSGANAHLTRSVLDASGSHQLADVAQSRLELTVRSFVRPIVLVFLPLILLVVAFAVWRRERLGAWLRDCPAMRAGLVGGVTAVVVGALANDSGALMLEIGGAYLLVFAGYVWADGLGPVRPG